MGANLQYQVPLKLIGNIFEEIKWDSGLNVNFIKESTESTYTLKVDLSDILDELLRKADFEIIEYTRSKLERAELHEDSDMIKELKLSLEEDYDREAIADYDEFEGDYRDYIEAVAKKVLEDFDSYLTELEDKLVFIETWL